MHDIYICVCVCVCVCVSVLIMCVYSVLIEGGRTYPNPSSVGGYISEHSYAEWVEWKSDSTI